MTKSFALLIYFIDNNSLVLVFLSDMANTILFMESSLVKLKEKIIEMLQSLKNKKLNYS